MNIEVLREYCLSKKGVTEEFPFNDTALVFKVMNKMFALSDLDGNLRINLKCEPDKAIEFGIAHHVLQPGQGYGD